MRWLVIIVMLGAAYSDDWWTVSNCTQLTPSDFWTVVGTDKACILEIYSPSCSHCKTFAPTYEQLWEHFSNLHPDSYRPDIVVAKIDGPEYHDFLEKFNFYSYPTVFVFQPNETEPDATYDGSKTLESLVNWALMTIDKTNEDRNPKRFRP